MTSPAPAPGPYGDRRPAPASTGPEPTWNRRAIALGAATGLTFIAAAAALVWCVVVVVTAPEGGGADFTLGYVGIAAVSLVALGGALSEGARRARRR
jgi:hypothetical protein